MSSISFKIIFQCVSWRDTLAASGENRLNAETIARHGAALRSAALQRPVWTRRDEEDSASSRADLPREESDIESANERETECNAAILRRGHLRLIDKCGLFMYNFFFLLKISRCGLFIGALYSPEFTVTTKIEIANVKRNSVFMEPCSMCMLDIKFRNEKILSRLVVQKNLWDC